MFVLNTSTIEGAGLGVFASEVISKGHLLKVEGILIPRFGTANECTHYADKYKFRLGYQLLIPFGFGGMVNHSDKPNMKKIIMIDSIYLQAMRKIDKGEELFWRYPARARDWK